MASTGILTFAWAVTLTKGTECERDEGKMDRTSANVRSSLAYTEYVKKKGRRRRSTQRRKRGEKKRKWKIWRKRRIWSKRRRRCR
jgi:hypothetical protein